MDTVQLKDEVINKIRTDADLYAAVSKALGVTPLSLGRVLRANEPRLTQKNVLIILSGYLGIVENDLLAVHGMAAVVAE